MKGFTLVEILIAIFVLSVGIVAVLYMFPIGLEVGKSSQMTTIANQLAQAKIEEVMSKSCSELSSGTSTENYGEVSDFPAYKRVTEITCLNTDFQPVSCDYDPTNNPNPLKKIKVTMFWKSPLGVSEKTLEIASLIPKR
jgi:prepilin-type N-terminal cleavage/methylation domain-containing protein